MRSRYDADEHQGGGVVVMGLGREVGAAVQFGLTEQSGVKRHLWGKSVDPIATGAQFVRESWCVKCRRLND